MTSTTKSLEDLKSIVSEQPVDADAVEASADSEPREYVRVVDDKGRSYATGKRKNAIARIWLKPGKGKIEVNGRPIEKYFARPALQMVIDHAFKVVGREKSYDVVATAIGGGLSGQAGAVRHGISKALVLQEPELRTPLKAAGLITRDSRVVERKKYGRRKARRSFQFSKR